MSKVGAITSSGVGCALSLCADPESFVRGSNFFLMRGERIQIALKACHHRSDSETPCINIECWLGSFVIFQGIRASIAEKPYIFVIFQGWGVPDPLPPLDPRMRIHVNQYSSSSLFDHSVISLVFSQNLPSYCLS